MINKFLFSFLYTFPFILLFWITEIESDFFTESLKMGFVFHFAMMALIFLLIFFIIRKIMNKIFNKFKSTNSVDYVTSKDSMIGVFVGYSILFFAIVMILVAPDTTSYGKWLRGFRELKIATELQKTKTNKEQSYIDEALQESKDKNQDVYKTTFELSQKLKKLENNKSLFD